MLRIRTTGLFQISNKTTVFKQVLFKKLIDLDMTSNELMEKANVSKSTFYKIKNGQNVTTDVLLRICNTLDCDISEIVECEKVI